MSLTFGDIMVRTRPDVGVGWGLELGALDLCVFDFYKLIKNDHAHQRAGGLFASLELLERDPVRSVGLPYSLIHTFLRLRPAAVSLHREGS